MHHRASPEMEKSFSASSLSRPIYHNRIRRQVASMMELPPKCLPREECRPSKSKSNPNIVCYDELEEEEEEHAGGTMLLRPVYPSLPRRPASPIEHSPTTFTFPMILSNAPSAHLVGPSFSAPSINKMHSEMVVASSTSSTGHLPRLRCSAPADDGAFFPQPPQTHSQRNRRRNSPKHEDDVLLQSSNPASPVDVSISSATITISALPSPIIAARSASSALVSLRPQRRILEEAVGAEDEVLRSCQSPLLPTLVVLDGILHDDVLEEDEVEDIVVHGITEEEEVEEDEGDGDEEENDDDDDDDGAQRDEEEESESLVSLERIVHRRSFTSDVVGRRTISDDSLTSIHDANNSSVSLGFSHSNHPSHQRSPRRVCVSFCPTVSVLIGDGEEAESTTNSEMAAVARSSPLKQDGSYHSFRAGNSSRTQQHWGEGATAEEPGSPSAEVLAQFVLQPEEISPSLRLMQEKMRDSAGLFSLFGGFGSFGAEPDEEQKDDEGVEEGENLNDEAVNDVDVNDVDDEDEDEAVVPHVATSDVAVRSAASPPPLMPAASTSSAGTAELNRTMAAMSWETPLEPPLAGVRHHHPVCVSQEYSISSSFVTGATCIDEDQPQLPQPRLRRNSTAQYEGGVANNNNNMRASSSISTSIFAMAPVLPLPPSSPPTHPAQDDSSTDLATSLSIHMDAPSTCLQEHIPRASWLLRAASCTSTSPSAAADVMVPSTVYSVATAAISSSTSSLECLTSSRLHCPASIIIGECVGGGELINVDQASSI